MRRVVCLALVGSVLLLASGCAQFSKEVVHNNRILVKGLTEHRTVTETYTEHLHRLTRAVVVQQRHGAR